MTTAQGRAAIRNHNAKLAAYQQLLEKVAPKPQQAAPQTTPAEAEVQPQAQPAAAEAQKAEAKPTSTKTKAEQKQPAKPKKPKEQAEPHPIGKGAFGNIYNQFKGKVKEAFDFLLKNKSGYLQGVFHREEIGDIDLAWGEAPMRYTGKGLAHILKKHVDTVKDFSSEQEAVDIIQDVIENGNAYDAGNNTWNIEKDNYRVVIARDNNGNWVLTAFDFKTAKKNKEDGSVTTLTPNQTELSEEAGAVASNQSSADKGTKNNSDGKTESGKSRRGQTAISSKKSIRKAIDKLFDGEVAGEFHQLAHIIREWLYRLGERHNFARGYGWIRDCSLLKLGTQDLVDLLRQSAQHLHNEGANGQGLESQKKIVPLQRQNVQNAFHRLVD